MPDVDNLQQLITCHGTVVFLDVGSGKLRHGQAASSPNNVFFALREGAGHLIHVLVDGGLREIRVAPGVPPMPVQLCDSPSDSPQTWSLTPAEAGTVGLFSDGLYLCAELDGAVTLSRQNLGAWERFSFVGQIRAERHTLETRPNFRTQILEKLWYGIDPFEDSSAFAGREELQGWRSWHPYLISAIDEVRPNIIVEIGVWKGGSTITMANHLKSSGMKGLVISVDTWLGSWDHWLEKTWFNSLRMEHGQSTLYRTFAANVIKNNLQDYIVPLPVDSANAAQILLKRGIVPGVVHLDAAHDYDSVSNDLRIWWPLIPTGGILIGDDYQPEGGWPDVLKAFNDFFGTTAIENSGGKCLIRKT